jgi:hypothetical protein
MIIMIRNWFYVHFTGIYRQLFRGWIEIIIVNAAGNQKMGKVDFVLINEHWIMECWNRRAAVHDYMTDGITWEVEIGWMNGRPDAVQRTSHRTEKNRPSPKDTNFQLDQLGKFKFDGRVVEQMPVKTVGLGRKETRPGPITIFRSD